MEPKKKDKKQKDHSKKDRKEPDDKEPPPPTPEPEKARPKPLRVKRSTPQSEGKMPEQYQVHTPRSAGSSAVLVETPKETVSDESDDQVMDAKALKEEVAALRRDKKLLHRELGEARASATAAPGLDPKGE